MKGNEAQKAKMKENEGPKGQNERKSKPKKAKMKGNQGPKGPMPQARPGGRLRSSQHKSEEAALRPKVWGNAF